MGKCDYRHLYTQGGKNEVDTRTPEERSAARRVAYGLSDDYDSALKEILKAHANNPPRYSRHDEYRVRLDELKQQPPASITNAVDRSQVSLAERTSNRQRKKMLWQAKKEQWRLKQKEQEGEKKWKEKLVMVKECERPRNEEDKTIEEWDEKEEVQTLVSEYGYEKEGRSGERKLVYVHRDGRTREVGLGWKRRGWGKCIVM